MIIFFPFFLSPVFLPISLPFLLLHPLTLLHLYLLFFVLTFIPQHLYTPWPSSQLLFNFFLLPPQSLPLILCLLVSFPSPLFPFTFLSTSLQSLPPTFSLSVSLFHLSDTSKLFLLLPNQSFLSSVFAFPFFSLPTPAHLYILLSILSCHSSAFRFLSLSPPNLCTLSLSFPYHHAFCYCSLASSSNHLSFCYPLSSSKHLHALSTPYYSLLLINYLTVSYPRIHPYHLHCYLSFPSHPPFCFPPSSSPRLHIS